MTTYIDAINNRISYKNVQTGSTNFLPDVTNVGQTFIPTSSGSQSIGLNIVGSPGATNASIGIQVATTSNALFTMTAISGTIEGQSTIVFGTGDSCVVYCDGTNYFLNNLFVRPSNFRAYLSSATNVPATGTTLTILFNTVPRNIGSFYASGTGIWTCLLPGVGIGGAQVVVNFDGTQNTVITAQLQKNGSAICTVVANGSIGFAETFTLVLNPGVMDFNGSTDNYKVVISQTGTNTQAISLGIDQTFFYAMRTGLF